MRILAQDSRQDIFTDEITSKNTTSEPEIGSDQTSGSTQKKPASTPSRQAAKLVALLKSEILRNKADYKITTAQERNWAVTAQRMMDTDKRDPERIEQLIRWVQRDEFELANVLSMEKLRKRFDDLEMKKARSESSRNVATMPLPATYVPASEKIRQELQERSAGGMQ